MTGFANNILYLAFVTTFVAAITSFLAGIKNDRRYLVAARNGIFFTALFLTIATIILARAFLIHDFSLEYVYSYSDRSMNPFYLITGIWAGQKGSLLFWVWILSLYSVILIIVEEFKKKEKRLSFAYTYNVLSVSMLFFLFLVAFITNPFEKLPITPPDGRGMNPLLQNPGMIFHPPTLYLGYVGFNIPFAYAVGALISRELDIRWIKASRRWTIISWIFLTIGIILGGKWAYVELGWGGYWAWDPVENASLMPWLTATAFLHSIMIQERRGMLKIWNMFLIAITFALCILGTFITRSGLLSSVHAFTQTSLGKYFIVFMLFMILSFGIILLWRKNDLVAQKGIESWLSRESTFLFNNLILLIITFSVLYGTLYPMISEAIRGVKVTVSAPFFNQVTAPLFLILILITGMCPQIGWRKATLSNIKRNFLIPAIFMVIAAISLVIMGIRKTYPIIYLSFSVFVLVTITMEFYTGTKARLKIEHVSVFKAFMRLLTKNKRRYGGYIVHTGTIMMVIGIIASGFYAQQNTVSLSKNDSFELAGYTFTYKGLDHLKVPNIEKFIATVSVKKNGTPITTLYPEKRFYINQNQPTTEASIYSTFTKDIYLILLSADEKGDFAVIRAFINPLVEWIWWGGFVIVIGAIWAILPSKKKRKR